MPVWDTNPSPAGPTDEYFFHATSKENADKIKKSGVIMPEYGKGANGKGFYCCTRINDYQKAMALRNDESNHPSLYILVVKVKGFYRMEGFFADGFAGEGSEGDQCDFIASLWYHDNIGGSGNLRPDKEYACYEEYKLQQFPIVGYDLPVIQPNQRRNPQYLQYSGRGPQGKGKPQFEFGTGYKERGSNRKSVIDTIWEKARRNLPYNTQIYCGKETEELNALIKQYGPRGVLAMLIEEITFKPQPEVGKSISVVGALEFGKDALTFDQEKKIDLW